VLSRDLTLVFVLGLVVSGCSSAAIPSASAPMETTAASPEVLASAAAVVATPLPAASASAFRSAVYPYTWALPVGIALRNWGPADRQWQTDGRIDSVAPYNDTNGTPDGSLFILGAPWAGTLGEFDTLIRTDVARFHGCKAPDEIRHLQIARQPAVSFRQLCGNGAYAARVILLHRAFGLVINLSEIAASKLPVVLDDVEAWLGGFAWTDT
jgi:hypothetical protein